MTEAVIASVASQVASKVTGETSNMYVQSDNTIKNRNSTGLGLGSLGLNTVTGFSRTLIFAAINFFILSVIFVTLLLSKLRTLYEAGDEARENYIKESLIKGVGLALVAAGVFAVVDFISGGVATLIMFIIYPLAGISMLILSLIAPVFMNDITEEIPNLGSGSPNAGEMISRISSYRLWSVSFWPIFIIGMLISLALGALISYLGVKISRLALDMITNLAANQTTGMNLGSFLAT